MLAVGPDTVPDRGTKPFAGLFPECGMNFLVSVAVAVPDRGMKLFLVVCSQDVG